MERHRHLSGGGQATKSQGMPRSAPRFAIMLAVGALLAGAGYLYAVRGSALLLDLSAMVGMLCF